MTNIKSFASTVFTIIAVVMVLDFIFFMGWVASGQKPVDNFYAGTISAHIIGAVVNK